MVSAAVAAADLVLRFSDAYRLVPLHRLTEEERRRLGEGCEGELFGVLRPASGGPGRPVGRETALLLFTLQEPGPWPCFLEEFSDAAPARGLASLVLDGVLEVADGERFVSGGAASGLLPLGGLEPVGRLASMSHAAVRWAAELGTHEVARTARRLYGFHRLPLTAAWSRRLGDVGAVERFLLDGRTLPPGWRRRPAERCDGWLGFEGSGAPAGRHGPFKLYLSPRPGDLPAVLDALFEGLAEVPASAVKLGATAADLLRPDKLMVYADRLEVIHELARGLLERLDGLEAHGVPFTAEIGGDGLVSWGVDRWRGDRVRSWRAWLIHRLARGLAAASATGPCADASTDASTDVLEAPPWRLALDRLRLEGVDVETWQPGAELWRPAA